MLNRKNFSSTIFTEKKVLDDAWRKREFKFLFKVTELKTWLTWNIYSIVRFLHSIPAVNSSKKIEMTKFILFILPRHHTHKLTCTRKIIRAFQFCYLQIDTKNLAFQLEAQAFKFKEYLRLNFLIAYYSLAFWEPENFGPFH